MYPERFFRCLAAYLMRYINDACRNVSASMVLWIALALLVIGVVLCIDIYRDRSKTKKAKINAADVIRLLLVVALSGAIAVYHGEIAGMLRHERRRLELERYRPKSYGCTQMSHMNKNGTVLIPEMKYTTATIEQALKAIMETRSDAEKFGEEFEKHAAKVTEDCEALTAKFAAEIPEFADRLKPAMSQELCDAYKRVGDPRALAQVAVAPVVRDVQAEVIDESDEAIPEATSDDPVEKVEVQIKELVASRRKSARKYNEEYALKCESVVKNMNNVWNRVYSCQASVVQIKFDIKSILVEADKSISNHGSDFVAAYLLKSTYSKISSRYNEIRCSPNVKNVWKCVGDIGVLRAESSFERTRDELFKLEVEFKKEIMQIDAEIAKLNKEKSEIEAKRSAQK